MRQLRGLQDETGGFTGFIPLPYQPDNNEIPVEHPPTGFDMLRTLAVARLYLDNFDHITAYTKGPATASARRCTGAARACASATAVSYTHLTLPTKRIV